MKLFDIIMGLIAIWFIILFVLVPFTFTIITETSCQNLCEEKGALTFERKSNGWWSLRDECICFFEYRTESFILGGKN